jgi:hypothetical protein
MYKYKDILLCPEQKKIMDLLLCSINWFVSAEFQVFPSSPEMSYREGLS